MAHRDWTLASDVRAESGRWTGSTQTSAQRRSSTLAAALLGLWADDLPVITQAQRLGGRVPGMVGKCPHL